jgi:hypothetical protein
MYATNYFETGVLNAFNGVTFSAPSSLYIALFLSNPSETGTAGAETNYPEYTRQPITFTPPYAESGGIGVKNAANILWNASSVDGGQIQFIGILDSNVIGAGNMLLYGQLTDPMTIRAGQQPSIYAGDVLYYSTGNFSVWFKTAMLNVLRGQNLMGFSPYLALFNGNPEQSGAELAGGAYARPVIVFNAPAEQASGQTLIQNSLDVTFPSPTSPWGVWGYDGIMDNSLNGNLITKFQNPAPENILKNYVPFVNAGDYKVALH